VKPTAVGVYLVVVPDFTLSGTWYVHALDLAGRWKFSAKATSKEQAFRKRRELVRLHKNIAARKAKQQARKENA
jgi:hypothetical protein